MHGVLETKPRATDRGLLRFVACGSVDDGKSTLIGRLLIETGSVADDQLASLASLSRRYGTTGDDLDCALKQRVLVRVEITVRKVVLARLDLRRDEQRLVELLRSLRAALLDEERDLLLADVRALQALQARRPERLEEHVALSEEALRACAVEDDP